MGNNVDLCDLLRLPRRVPCERCKYIFWSNFDDYDIDCGHPESSWPKNNGCLVLEATCPNCDQKNLFQFKTISSEVFELMENALKILSELKEKQDEFDNQ